jgi:hypothetical protein
MERPSFPAAQVQEQPQNQPLAQTAHVACQRGGGIRVQMEGRIRALAHQRQPEEVEPVTHPGIRDRREGICEGATGGQLNPNPAHPGQRREVPAASIAILDRAKPQLIPATVISSVIAPRSSSTHTGWSLSWSGATSCAVMVPILRGRSTAG